MSVLYLACSLVSDENYTALPGFISFVPRLSCIQLSDVVQVKHCSHDVSLHHRQASCGVICPLIR